MVHEGASAQPCCFLALCPGIWDLAPTTPLCLQPALGRQRAELRKLPRLRVNPKLWSVTILLLCSFLLCDNPGLAGSEEEVQPGKSGTCSCQPTRFQALWLHLLSP